MELLDRAEDNAVLLLKVTVVDIVIVDTATAEVLSTISSDGAHSDNVNREPQDEAVTSGEPTDEAVVSGVPTDEIVVSGVPMEEAVVRGVPKDEAAGSNNG
jgi:hypothetical protein